MKTSRQIVAEMLIKMESNKSYSNILLDHTLSQEKLENRDKALAASLFYGVLERRMTLDHIIRQYSNIEFDKIHPQALSALRLGLYQLLFMNSIPENAAVDESVKILPHHLKGFVNAILRNFLRNNKHITYENLDEISRISVEFSCARWIVKMWVSQFGVEKTLNILKSSLGKPPIYLRVNTLKHTVDQVKEQLKKENIIVNRFPSLDDCLVVENTGAIESTHAYRKGMFHVQDISSQLCCRIVRPTFNETVLDVCSAPGGKSFTMAQLMANRGKLYSYDLYEGRLSMLREGAKRLGIQIIQAIPNDATVYNENIPMADKVLCDVVCSGLGVIRRKPEIKYKAKKSLEGLPELQSKILETSSRYVKPGGTLIYSTCTINKEENEQVAQAFLDRNKSFIPVVVPIQFPGIENSCMRTFLPSQTGGDGFFIATFRRTE